MHAVYLRRLALTCGCVAAAVMSASARLAAQGPKLTVEPYALHLYDGRSERIELGTLAVPESRAARNRATITLAFLLLRSTSSAPGSPIVFLMGGPGIPASVMAPIPPYWTLFERLRAVGDVILLDQRGAGLSTPKLDCPPLGQAPDNNLLSSRSSLVGAFARAYAGCDSLWRRRGVDPRAYSVAASADDIDAVRRALGAARVSLLGFSYGTRLALEFVRRHAGRVDRLVLQGPETPDLRYRSPLTLDSLFRRYAELASADSASAPFSARLPSRLHALLDSLAHAPVAVRVRSPAGDSVTLAVGKEGLQAIVAEHPGDPAIPALIASLERGDTRLLARRAEAVYAELASGGGPLMGRAAECSDLPSVARVERVDADGAASLLGPLLDNEVIRRSFCDEIGLDGQAAAGGVFRAAAGRLPALILVGDLDTQTPLSNAAAIARSLPGSIELVVHNGEHEVLPDSVVQDAVVDFLAGREVADRHLRVEPPRFLSLEEALHPPPGHRR